MSFKIGFACKYMHPDRLVSDTKLTKKELDQIESRYNMRTTTVKWARDNPDLIEARLWSIAQENIQCIMNLLTFVSTLPVGQRMVRLSSDVFPLYTHADFKWFYKQKSFKKYAAANLITCGDFARQHGIRLSMHPGQFVVLASDNPNIVNSSIEEFEYHVDIIRWLGYGKTNRDMKCNVHLSGRGGEKVFRKAFARLSDEAKLTMTIENDEFGSGLSDVLAISDLVPIVLDIHHHWINTGEYISPRSVNVQQVIDSWCGVRPTMHYSYSPEQVLNAAGFYSNSLKKPDLATLEAKKTELRAHSNDYPNLAANRWALSFLPQFDIMCESKYKNLASTALYELYTKLK